MKIHASYLNIFIKPYVNEKGYSWPQKDGLAVEFCSISHLHWFYNENKF